MGDAHLSERAFYARSGSTWNDLVTLLHPPYTLWHLSYVAIGAAIAPNLDWRILAGTLLAFFFGLGIGAHALDEVRGRPLKTGMSDRTLWVLGVGGLAAGGAIGVIGAFELGPMVVVWAVIGVLLAAGYALEWWSVLHSDWGFALAWGAFPVLVGSWAQTGTIDLSAVLIAGAMTVVSRAQRALSTPARRMRRTDDRVEVSGWDRAALIATWEQPLRLLSVAVPLVALALLASHL